MKKFDITVFEPCDDAVVYYDTKTSFEQAWEECDRGDWLMWIAFNLEIDEELLIRVVVECVKTVSHLVTAASIAACDERSVAALAADADYPEKLKLVANICRKYLTDAVLEKVNEQA